MLLGIHNLTASSVLCRLLPSTFTSWVSIHITPLTLLLLSSPKTNSPGCFWFSSHLPSQQHQLTHSLFLETFSSLGFCGPTLSWFFLPITYAASSVFDNFPSIHLKDGKLQGPQGFHPISSLWLSRPSCCLHASYIFILGSFHWLHLKYYSPRYPFTVLTPHFFEILKFTLSLRSPWLPCLKASHPTILILSSLFFSITFVTF